jgi:hypothetical protein
LLVDGTAELRLANPQQMSQALQKAAAGVTVPVRIKSVSIDGNPAVVRAHIEADGKSEQRKADVYVAIALNHAESQVLRGENHGRHLTHVSVLQNLKKVGSVEPGKSAAEDFEFKLKPGTDLANIRIVAFVQEPGPGKVLGAALQKAPFR